MSGPDQRHAFSWRRLLSSAAVLTGGLAASRLGGMRPGVAGPLGDRLSGELVLPVPVATPAYGARVLTPVQP